jgi:hypothetical protein
MYQQWPGIDPALPVVQHARSRVEMRWCPAPSIGARA